MVSNTGKEEYETEKAALYERMNDFKTPETRRN